ncbi:nucleotidyltransferase family protein [[Limnothrix rosea] IAM M-220]|uniref:nucleotidyltransferase family protein n=1 Tax=[Limnothrix rosea] IAM M-220 TaxID=454133 RepID=UPI000969E5E7|nr:nucleotidyltransferase family protein [[Limnothrix rosea] IAM M-220]OKH13434.1 nucleotidyltransferase [[Limnothrix rosea] IAM M-220]
MQTLPISFTEADIQEFCERYFVEQLALFGSVLRDDFGVASDVDILVHFPPEKTPSFFTMSEMQDHLTKIFGRTVDLRTPEELSPYFREKVLATALVIYDKN